MGGKLLAVFNVDEVDGMIERGMCDDVDSNDCDCALLAELGREDDGALSSRNSALTGDILKFP